MNHPHRLAAPPEAADDDPTVAALMTTHLVGITPDAPLSTALRLMATTGVRHLPVLSGTRCLGMVTESDVLHALATAPSPLHAAPDIAMAALTRRSVTVAPTDRRSTAARRMREAGTDAVLVVRTGTLVGIVTATDVVRSLASEPSRDRP